ncbi:unnamed protein product [Blepharisma stoltei]|uniref:Phosphatidylinositol-specific phospholipase C X domain-containing protein n=1 Tax=Blepharisma stoltei TaxID=1481888 RepID=A0AAU9JZW4_9CILI|nr:unnamed protein product [Blepharisma stoltei]
MEPTSDNEQPLLGASRRRNYSDWMGEIFTSISSKKLSQLFIPGSHDSGTYRTAIVFRLARTWIQCQDKNFLEQLEAGIRYLDCRINCGPDLPFKDDRFYFAHDVCMNEIPLQELIDNVNTFINAHQREIIILDISHFKKFKNYRDDPKDWIDFSAYFEPWLKEGLVIEKEDAEKTVGQLINERKRIMILTSKPQIFGNGRFKESINAHKEWANERDPAELRNFLEARLNEKASFNDLWLLQCQLTPKFKWGKMFHGCEYLAEKLNENIREWFSTDLFLRANVVFTDFSTENCLVEIAIQENARRQV